MNLEDRAKTQLKQQVLRQWMNEQTNEMTNEKLWSFIADEALYPSQRQPYT